MTTAHSGSGDLGRSLALLWGVDDAPSRGPKPGLTLEQIVTAAVELADSEGLGALSMRRVAGELGTGTMSLYRYVPGKGELLDLMLDHVSFPAAAHRRPPRSWRKALEQVAHGIWDLYHEHPWLLQVNQSRPVLGPNSLAGMDYALAGMDKLPLTGREKVAVIMTIDHLVTGTARTYVQQEQAAAETGLSDEDFWGAQEPLLVEAMESGRYPHVAQLPEDAFSIGGTEALQFGLGPLLDGLETLVAKRKPAALPRS